MTLYRSAGYLILGSRLKRLGGKVLSEIRRVYEAKEVDFEPSWFPVFYVLNRERDCTIGMLADALEVSHSAMSQSVSQLEKKGLLKIGVQESDSRKKQLSLTVRGERLLSDVLPIWQAFEKSFRLLLEKEEAMHKSPLEQIDHLEAILGSGHLSEMALRFLGDHMQISVTVIEAESAELTAVREKYGLSSSRSLEGQGLGLMLEGGLAAYAFYRAEDNMVRIVEFFVLPPYRNNGIGRRLLREIADKEKGRGASFLLTVADKEVIGLLASSGYPFSVVPELEEKY